MTQHILGIIDAQRGFMPETEGQRLHQEGFGELAVPHGEKIVPNVNRLLDLFASLEYPTFTTKDYHPWSTAHFSKTPDYKTTWPIHCVAGTNGAKLHPDIQLPATTRRFIKGTESLQRGEDDTSYSAFYAHGVIPILGRSMSEWLREQQASDVYLGGLALEHCVGKSALDFKHKLGLSVTVITDASAGIDPEASRRMLQDFERAGVKTATTEQVVRAVAKLASGPGRI